MPAFRHISFRCTHIILLVVCLWLSACTSMETAPDSGTSPSTLSTPVTAATEASVGTPTPRVALPNPTPELGEDLNHTPGAPSPSTNMGTSLDPSYNIAVRFDYKAHYLSVGQSLIFTNNSGETLHDLVLVVEPNRWPGSFNLISLTWGDGIPVADYSLSGNSLKIALAQPINPGTKTSLSLTFELSLPEIPEASNSTRPIPFGYTAHQSNVVDWYPFLPPYQPGTGWVVHNPWQYGEHQVYESADYQVEIRTADPIPNLTIAASAPADMLDGRYRYELKSARTFVFSVSENYIVSSNTVDGIGVYSYSFLHDRTSGEAALQYASEALQLYSELFGPYPHPRLSIVEADFLDGMEYSGMFFLGRGFYNTFDGSPGGYLTAIAVHETAHQWWYEQVGNDQALEPWLDEALCTYAERLYYEHVHPELLDFWWAFRVNYYEPSGWVNGSIYDYTGFRPYRDAVYLRGTQFLEELRTLIGDEAFFAFMYDYANRYKGQLVTAHDFFSLLTEHTTTDINTVQTTFFDPEK